MNFPKMLKSGDTVGLICPSSPVTPQRVKECVKAVTDLGYNVKAAENLTENYGGYMAGTAQTRARWVNEMFADDEVDAIFCVRGGDGSSRIMEYLDYDMIRRHPKIFVGYSDITNLHLALTARCELVTFHGPMVSSNMVDHFDDETRASFYSVINGRGTVEFQNPRGEEIRVLQSGKAEGRLIGGNLSLLSASVDTPYQVDTEGAILFIEEVSEPVSKIEKWGYHLRNAGLLAGCRGVILGQFTRIINDTKPQFDALQCFADILQGLDIPVLCNVQSGHGKPMMTLPMGAMCRMDAEAKRISFVMRP